MNHPQLLYNREPIELSKLERVTGNTKWLSVTLDKNGSSLRENSVHIKGKNTITIKHLLNTICTESFLWNVLITFSIFLNFMLVTYTYIFYRPTTINFKIFYIILVLDCLFILDVVRSTALYLGQHKLGIRQTDRRSMCLICLDCILSLPIDYIIYYFHPQMQSKGFLTLRLISTARAYRIVAFFKECNRGIDVNRNIIGAAGFLSIFALVLQTLSCVVYLTDFPLFEFKSNTLDKEIFANVSDATFSNYLKSFCCAFLTMSHFGYGLIKPESTPGRIYTSMHCLKHVIVSNLNDLFVLGIGMIFGYLIYIGILIPIVWNCLIFNNRNRILIQIQKQYVINHLKNICYNHLIAKVMSYYSVFWMRKKGKLNLDILPLNPAMEMDFQFDINYKYLREIVIFRDQTEGYLRRIASLMKHEFYSTGEFIFIQNTVKDKMICVVKGTIDILSYEDSNSSIISFGPGTCLSECSLVLQLLSKTAVKAASYVELQVLYREDFYPTIPHYPKEFIAVNNQILKRIQTSEHQLIGKKSSSFFNMELTYIEKLKGNTKTKTRINLSQGCVYYQISKKSTTIAKDLTRIYVAWRLIVCICAIYVAITYPYYICFTRSYPDIIGTISEIVFILDVLVIVFRKTIKRTNTGITWKWSEALKCFQSNYFYLNIFSAFPFDIFALARSPRLHNYFMISMILKLNRICKIYKIYLVLNVLEAKFRVRYYYVKIARILFSYILVLYWVASLLYFFTCYNNSCVRNGWFLMKLLQESRNKILEPITRNPISLSMYFSTCTLLGIEFGDVIPTHNREIVLVGFAIFLGKIMRAVILASFIAIHCFKSTSNNLYQTKIFNVLRVLNRNHFPTKLHQRVTRYYYLQWMNNNCVTAKDLDPIDQLPKNIEKEIRISECLDALESVKLFTDFEDEFLKWIAYNVNLIVLPSKEIVLYQGSMNRTLYVLQKGFCSERNFNGTNRKVGPQSVFGYNSFLFNIPEHSQVTTLTDCQFVVVNFGVLKMADVEFPSLMERIRFGVDMCMESEVASHDIKMLEYSLEREVQVKHEKLDCGIKNKYNSFEDSYTYMIEFCKLREDYYWPFRGLGHFYWLRYVLMPISFHPNGLFLHIWTITRLLIAILYGLLIPVQLIVAPYHTSFHLFITLMDIFTYMDLYIRLHVAYYNSNHSILIRHPLATSVHYLRGPFLLDLAVCLPIEWILAAVWGPGHDGGHTTRAHAAKWGTHGLHCALRLGRVLQLYRVIGLVKYYERELRLKRYILAIFSYLCLTILIINAWACVWIYSTCEYCNTLKNSDDDAINLAFRCKEQSWFRREQAEFSDVYVSAIYFVTSVSLSLGFGDITPKGYVSLDLAVAMVIINWILITYFIAKIVASSRYSSERQEHRRDIFEYQNKLKQLSTYLRNNGVGRIDQRHLNYYLQYVWSRNQGKQALTVFSETNESLRQDCVSFLYEETLKKVPVFRRMGRAFYRTIGQHLEEHYFLQDQFIIRSSDVVDKIYIVKKGKVDFHIPDGILQFTMGPGGIFGNFSGKLRLVFGGSVVANTNVDILVLNCSDFINVIKEYDIFRKRLELVMIRDREYYATPDVKLDVTADIKKKRKYALSVPLSSYHNTLQRAIIRKTIVNNSLNFLFALAAYLNILLVFYQFSFQDYSLKYILLSAMLDIIFVLKMCLAFQTPDINKFGDLMKEIQYNYFTRKLSRSFDIFLNFTSILSYLIFYLPSQNIACSGFTIWRLICLLRIFYLYEFFKKKNLDIQHNKCLMTICSIFVYLSLFIHTSACIWYSVVCPMAKCQMLSWGSIRNAEDTFEMYIASISFIISIFTTTGKSDILPRTNSEMLYVAVLIIFSNIVNAIIISEVLSYIYAEVRLRYEHNVKDLKTCLKLRHTRRYQIKRVVQYLKNIWKYSNGNQIPAIISDLPISIKTDLLWSIYGKTFRESYIFSKTEEPFLRHLVTLVDIQIYFSNDYITREANIDERMFFIFKGEVKIVTHTSNQTDIIQDVLYAGDVFGLGQGLFIGVPHHFSFRACTTTEIMSLKLEKWKYLLELFPSSRDVIYDRIETVYL